MPETKYYDLTPSQKLMFYEQKFSTHRQINNIFILMLVEKKLDFDALRSAIEEAYQQNDCFRLRITKIEKTARQYFAEYEKPDIGLLDFTGRTPKQMENKLSRLAHTPIKIYDCPMTRVYMVRTPEGLDGIYFGVNHIIMDAWAIGVFLDYVMSAYESVKCGSGSPRPLSPYEPLLQKELEYTETPQYQKDREFWFNEFEHLPEPMFSHVNGRCELEKNRKKYKNPDLRYGSIFTLRTAARHEVLEIPKEHVDKIAAYCQQQRVSMQSVFMFGLRHALSKLNERQEDITFMATVARRATVSEKRAGGTRAQATRFRTVFGEDCTFEQACHEIARYQTAFYRHAAIPMQELMKMERARYNKPGMFNSYNAGLMTFQPMRLALSDGTPMRTKWYCNGAFAMAFYLNIMDADGTGALQCYYEYQYKNVERGRIRMMHNIMVQSIMAGIENPSVTIGELLDMPEA